MIKISHRDPRFIEGFVKECAALGLEPEDTTELYDTMEKEAFMGALGTAGRVAGLGLGALGLKYMWDKAMPHQTITNQVGDFGNLLDKRTGVVSQISGLNKQHLAIQDQLKALRVKPSNDQVQAQIQELQMADQSIGQSLEGYNSRFNSMTNDVGGYQKRIGKDISQYTNNLVDKQESFRNLSEQHGRGGLPGWWAGTQMRWKNRNGGFNSNDLDYQQDRINKLQSRATGFNKAPAPARPPAPWELE